MGIRFILMVNKQGQTRLAQYYENLSLPERRALEGEIVCKCLARTEQQCSFVEHQNYKIVYRRCASLFFLVGVKDKENELAILEFIHLLVETMDRQFGNVCELDIMIHLEKAHFIVEEMVMNGCIVQTDKNSILSPLHLMDRTSSSSRTRRKSSAKSPRFCHCVRKQPQICPNYWIDCNDFGRASNLLGLKAHLNGSLFSGDDIQAQNNGPIG